MRNRWNIEDACQTARRGNIDIMPEVYQKIKKQKAEIKTTQKNEVKND